MTECPDAAEARLRDDAIVRGIVAQAQREARAEGAQAVLTAVEAEHEPTGIPESAVRWYLLGQQTAARRARAAASGERLGLR